MDSTIGRDDAATSSFEREIGSMIYLEVQGISGVAWCQRKKGGDGSSRA
jgi:hypothetical protein